MTVQRNFAVIYHALNRKRKGRKKYENVKKERILQIKIAKHFHVAADIKEKDMKNGKESEVLS